MYLRVARLSWPLVSLPRQAVLTNSIQFNQFNHMGNVAASRPEVAETLRKHSEDVLKAMVMKRREAEYCRCFKCAEVLVERDGGSFDCDGCGKKIDEVRYTCPKSKQTEDGRTVPRCDVDYCVDCWGEIIEAVKLSLRKGIDDGEMEAASRSGSRSPPGQESRGLRGLSRDDDGSSEEEPLAFSGGGAPRSFGGGPRRAQWSSDDDDDDAALAASSPAHRSTARAPRPRLRPLAPKKNVIYTATGPRSVAFEAESFNVFVWLLPHSKELVAALKKASTDHKEATHDPAQEWLRCSVSFEQCVAQLTKSGGVFGDQASKTPPFKWDGSTPVNVGFTVWRQPGNVGLTMRGRAAVEVLRQRAGTGSGSGSDNGSSSQPPDERDLEVTETHWVQIEVARSKTSSPSLTDVLGHMKKMEGRLTDVVFEAAELVVCASQRAFPTACILIPEEILAPPQAAPKVGGSPKGPKGLRLERLRKKALSMTQTMYKCSLDPTAFISEAVKAKLCTKYFLYMICEVCGGRGDREPFEMQVMQGKCEELEKCLPVAKATLQLASVVNFSAK